MSTYRTAESLPTPTPLVLTWQPCRCCRDLPAYLTCCRSAVAACDVCGWQGWFEDVDDAPETCPACAGTGITDPHVRALCAEWDAFYAGALLRLEAWEREAAGQGAA